MDGCQINLTSLSSSQSLRIIDDGSVNAKGGFGKKGAVLGELISGLSAGTYSSLQLRSPSM